MYKPANIREFVTAATLNKVVEVEVNGRITKQKQTVKTLRGKFKQKGTVEINANGLTVINDRTSFTTWYSNDIEAHDILTINGADYQIIGTPENVEMRGRYIILTLDKISGGA